MMRISSVIVQKVLIFPSRERVFLINRLIILKQSLGQGDALAPALITSLSRVNCKHSFCKI